MDNKMYTTNENIRQLVELLDNPDAYTEQELQNIINRDEDTREVYRLMVEAKRCSRHRQDNKPADVNAAWQRINQRLRMGDGTSEMRLQPKQHGFGRMKIAASIIGVILVSGIALAAIHMVHQSKKTETPKAEVSESVGSPITAVPTDTLVSDTVTVQPVIYDNIPLEKMLPEIAAHYDAKVTFQSDEARGFRFRFVWNPQQGIGHVVSDLNQFERLKVTLKDNLITVE